MSCGSTLLLEILAATTFTILGGTSPHQNYIRWNAAVCRLPWRRFIVRFVFSHKWVAAHGSGRRTAELEGTFADSFDLLEPVPARLDVFPARGSVLVTVNFGFAVPDVHPDTPLSKPGVSVQARF